MLIYKHSAPLHNVCLSCPMLVHAAECLSADESRINEISSLLSPGKDARTSAVQRGIIIKAAFYAVQVFYSFFIMYDPSIVLVRAY